MAEAFDVILKALGGVLNGIYELIPSYGLAIILLTILVRALMIPLTVKQIRSMTAMQRVQPEIKKLQQKYKGDRQKLNEELMKLYKEHGVNPLGGCLPLLAQSPVFIALYAVLRASIFVVPLTVMQSFPTPAPQGIPADAFTKETAAKTFCRPDPNVPEATGPSPTVLVCETTGQEGQRRFTVGKFVDRANRARQLEAPYIALCRPAVDDSGKPVEFQCASRPGTGHLPQQGELFSAITQDRGTFLGMHLGCSVSQAQSQVKAKECTSDPNAAGGTASIPYYLLLAAVVGTTYYQSKQMASRATGQAAQQQKMMTRIMPIFIGLISINFPSGVALYWTTTNFWTIGQQAVILSKQPPPPPEDETPAKPAKPSKGGPNGSADKPRGRKGK